jgi:hypothetical protein
MRTLLILCACLALCPLLSADEPTIEIEVEKPAAKPEVPAVFEAPIQLMAGDAPVATESPGFAAPTFVDVDGDGKRDLVVGQFSKGKMHFFQNVGTDTAPKFAKGTFLMTGDEPALVPDVW